MQHAWVALSYVPIEVEIQHNGNLHTFTNGDMAEEVAREDSALVCFICGETLTTDSYHTECPGSKNIAGDLDKS